MNRIVLIATALIFTSGIASGATFDVVAYILAGDHHDANPGDGQATSTAGYVTLRSAIEEANALPGKDRIRIILDTSIWMYDRNVQMYLGPLSVTEDLEIVNASSHIGNLVPIYWADSVNTITVESGAILTLSGIDWDALYEGGPIFVVKDGAELAAYPMLDLNTRTGVLVGRGSGSIMGSAFRNEGGRIRLEDSLVWPNSGLGNTSAVANIGGTMNLHRVIFLQNGNGMNQGALYVDGGDVLMESCTFDHNTAERGGGLYVESGTVTVVNSTFGENVARDTGAGIFVNGGNVTILNTTIARNEVDSGDSEGEGAGSEGESISLGVGGIEVREGASVRLGNTLIAENTDGAGPSDVTGTFVSLGHNLIGVADGAVGFDADGDITGTASSPIDPLFIGTFTGDVFYVPAESPAVDAGNNLLLSDPGLVPALPLLDLVGGYRFQGASVDIGSYESQKGRLTHTADQDADNVINLSELLRIIQFFNSGGFSCAEAPDATEDGYLPAPPGSQTCPPHANDYAPFDWNITLSELLRAIQFFNSDGYTYCPDDDTEDGYCPVVG